MRRGGFSPAEGRKGLVRPDSVQEGTRFEPSVPLAVKTLLGHAFRRPTLCGSNPGGHGGGCWRYELYLCVTKIWRRVCAIAPSHAPDARAIFGHVT
jgi:hypothetical protein